MQRVFIWLRKHSAVLLGTILLMVLAFYLRSFELHRDLVFAYDQGRDAWQMIAFKNGDLTLLGPTTGLSGVFLGPFWFYLLFPFYFLASWDPMGAAYGMVLFHVCTIPLLIVFGKRIGNWAIGFFAATLYTFSFANIMFARWVSNPTPLPFFSLLAFLLLWIALEKRRLTLFALSGFCIGLCIQLEAANAVWFIPVSIAIVFMESMYKKTRRASSNHWLQSFWIPGLCMVAGFLLAISPQIVFEIKNSFLTTQNIVKAFSSTHEESLTAVMPGRILLLYELYSRALFAEAHHVLLPLLGLAIFLMVFHWRVLRANLGFRILLLLFGIPLFFHVIYTGNHGNFWDYYIIASHPVFYLLLAVLFFYPSKPVRTVSITRAAALLFLLISVGYNLRAWSSMRTPYEQRYSLQMQERATDWMIDQAQGQRYGVWVYTPSAQDEAHRYVFYLQGTRRGVFPQEHVEQQPIIFLVVEDDPVYWKRRKEWIEEKKKFGTEISSKRFGAIEVVALKSTFVGKNQE